MGNIFTGQTKSIQSIKPKNDSLHFQKAINFEELEFNYIYLSEENHYNRTLYSGDLISFNKKSAFIIGLDQSHENYILMVNKEPEDVLVPVLELEKSSTLIFHPKKVDKKDKYLKTENGTIFDVTNLFGTLIYTNTELVDIEVRFKKGFIVGRSNKGQYMFHIQGKDGAKTTQGYEKKIEKAFKVLYRPNCYNGDIFVA